jgi:hypothetical protein
MNRNNTTNAFEVVISWMLVVMLILAVVIGVAAYINRNNKPNKRVWGQVIEITESDLQQIKGAIHTIEKDGRCFSIIVNQDSGGIPAVSHTWVPCTKGQQKAIEEGMQK